MEQVFLTVFHRGIAAGWLIAAVIIVRFFMKKAPRRIICLLWIAAGLRLACPFQITSAFSLLPEKKMDLSVFDKGIRADSRTAPQAANVPLQKDSLQAQEESAAPETDSVFSGMLRAAAYVWAAGMLAMLLYLAFGWRRVRAGVSTAVPAEYDGTKFYFCDFAGVPFLFGAAAPKIYVPFSAAGQELSYVLLHEKAHKSRFDHFVKPAGYLLLAVHWYHPLVWAAYLLMCRDIELACDEKVIRELDAGCRKAYAQALLSCAAGGRPAVYPVSFGEIGVKNRVKNIVSYKKPKIWVSLAAVCVCAAVTVCFATDAKTETDTGTGTKTRIEAGTETGKKTEDKKETEAGRRNDDAQKADDAVRKHIAQWAEAFCSRDAAAISGMLDETGRRMLAQAGMLEGTHSFGWSSPWPWEAGVIDDAPNYRIVSAGQQQAVVLFYAWTSDPHVTVWQQALAYQYQEAEDTFLVTSVKTAVLDSIASADEFYAAYPDGVINGTKMDYYHGNGAGGALNDNMLLSSTYQARSLFMEPDAAAFYLLNVDNDPSKVTAEVSEKDGETVVTFTFAEDGGSARVKMIRFSGSHTIWIPQTADRQGNQLS